VPSPGPAATPGRPRLRATRLAPLAAIAAGFVLFFAFGLHRHVTFETLRDSRAALSAWVAAHEALAPLLYILAYAVVVACSLPVGLLATPIGGFLFGTLLGGTYAVIGATIGATALFLAARSALGELLRAKAGGALARFEAGFRENAFAYLLVLRLIPLFPFFLVNLAPAFLGVPLATFVAATFVGIIPATFVYASVGAGLGAVFDAGAEPDFGIVLTPPVLGPLLGLALLALAPVAYRHFKKPA
jgi:uncharacterized membrane protein YdjX (TVP38/TMEM64 family)